MFEDVLISASYTMYNDLSFNFLAITFAIFNSKMFTQSTFEEPVRDGFLSFVSNRVVNHERMKEISYYKMEPSKTLHYTQWGPSTSHENDVVLQFIAVSQHGT